MNGKISLFLSFIIAIAFYHCHHSDKASVAATAPDTLQINNRIKAKQEKKLAVLSDSVKLLPSIKKSPVYFSISRFYYDSVTKELFKAENIFPATGRPVFVAYFDSSHVVKTVAHTEFGWYDYYFSSEETNATAKNSSKPENSQRSWLRQQCLKLAKEQLTAFQRKLKN